MAASSLVFEMEETEDARADDQQRRRDCSRGRRTRNSETTGGSSPKRLRLCDTPPSPRTVRVRKRHGERDPGDDVPAPPTSRSPVVAAVGTAPPPRSRVFDACDSHEPESNVFELVKVDQDATRSDHMLDAEAVCSPVPHREVYYVEETAWRSLHHHRQRRGSSSEGEGGEDDTASNPADDDDGGGDIKDGDEEDEEEGEDDDEEDEGEEDEEEGSDEEGGKDDGGESQPDDDDDDDDESDEDQDEGPWSRLKPLLPAPPLPPLPPNWSFDEKTRVLLGDLRGSHLHRRGVDGDDAPEGMGAGRIGREDEVFMLKMMERDDVTVVTEGLVMPEELDPTLWSMDYLRDTVGGEVYHRFRVFERVWEEVEDDEGDADDGGDERVEDGDGANGERRDGGGSEDRCGAGATAAAAAGGTSVPVGGNGKKPLLGPRRDRRKRGDDDSRPPGDGVTDADGGGKGVVVDDGDVKGHDDDVERKLIMDPHPNDVIVNYRGYDRVGNNLLRALANERRDRYLALNVNKLRGHERKRAKEGRLALAEEIVLAVRSQVPHGRFLRRLEAATGGKSGVGCADTDADANANANAGGSSAHYEVVGEKECVDRALAAMGGRVPSTRARRLTPPPPPPPEPERSQRRNGNSCTAVHTTNGDGNGKDHQRPIIISDPHPNDVIIQVGSQENVSSRAGNQLFRTLTSERREMYLAFKNSEGFRGAIDGRRGVASEGRQALAEEIVRAVRAQDPPGRFLKEVSGKVGADDGSPQYEVLGEGGSVESTKRTMDDYCRGKKAPARSQQQNGPASVTAAVDASAVPPRRWTVLSPPTAADKKATRRSPPPHPRASNDGDDDDGNNAYSTPVIISDPHPNDVIIQVGSQENLSSRVGNGLFNTLASERRERFLSLDPRRRGGAQRKAAYAERHVLAEEIVRAVQAQDPPGRFLRRVNGRVGSDGGSVLYEVVGLDGCIKKAKKVMGYVGKAKPPPQPHSNGNSSTNGHHHQQRNPCPPWAESKSHTEEAKMTAKGPSAAAAAAAAATSGLPPPSPPPGTAVPHWGNGDHHPAHRYSHSHHNGRNGEKDKTRSDPTPSPSQSARRAAAAATSKRPAIGHHQLHVDKPAEVPSSQPSSGMGGRKRRRHHFVTHRVTGSCVAMRVRDFVRYLEERERHLSNIAGRAARRRRMRKTGKTGTESFCAAGSQWQPESLDEEAQCRCNLHGEEMFQYDDENGIERGFNCVDTVLYLIDLDVAKLLPALNGDFVGRFRFPEILPGGSHCLMNKINPGGRPFMGPNLYVTPPSAFTHFHQDGHGTVDSGHQCLSGYNEVVMLRRMTEERKRHALFLLAGEDPIMYDALYGLPHADGKRDMPRWPSSEDIRRCRDMNYYPSVFILKPGQFVHINKGRLHAFRKLAPSSLPAGDCHADLRSALLEQKPDLVDRETLCVSVAWDWTYKGITSDGTNRETAAVLECASLNRKNQTNSLAIPETSILYLARELSNKCREEERSEEENNSSVKNLLCSPIHSQPSSFAYRPKAIVALRGILPSLSHVVERHKAAHLLARQGMTKCNGPRVSVASRPNSWENPQLFTLDPYGNDFFCKLCHEELSNLYMHCDGCEMILNKDFNICVSCHAEGKYKVRVQMHPLNEKRHSTINHTGDFHRNRQSRCPCKNGPVCRNCSFCAGCSCKCHQRFTLQYRFMDIDDEVKLLERVEGAVGNRRVRHGAETEERLLASRPLPSIATGALTCEEAACDHRGSEDLEEHQASEMVPVNGVKRNGTIPFPNGLEEGGRKISPAIESEKQKVESVCHTERRMTGRARRK